MTVRVGNQKGYGGRPTINIRDLLKAEGYNWTASGWQAWYRTYPANGLAGFYIEPRCSVELESITCSAGQAQVADVRGTALGSRNNVIDLSWLPGEPFCGEAIFTSLPSTIPNALREAFRDLSCRHPSRRGCWYARKC